MERGSSVGTMPDSQSREPGFESPLLPFRSLGIFFHFTTPRSTQLYDHITPVLRELHWLPITSRIQYKVTLLVYKTLHGPAPQYLQDLIQYRSARPGLRSAGILLNVPMTRSVTYGDRAFCSIGPTWWNSLPSELKTSPSEDSFKRNLKTHLFKLAYGQ